MTDTNNTQQLVPSAQKVAPVQKADALTALTKQLGLVDQEEVYNIMMKTVMPSGASYEELAAFCMTASAYKLNPLIKEIHAFRAKSGGIQPMVGIDGWLKLLHANSDYDGMEHEYAEDKSWVECRIYSKSKRRPTIVREYMEENRVESSPVWKQRPLRMLRHRATIQAVRYFMGIGGLADREEFLEFDQVNSSPVNVQGRVVKPSFLELAHEEEADEIPGLGAEVDVPQFGELI